MNDISFEILSTSIEGNSIIVRPYSTEFKHPPDAYAPANINISSLDKNVDILTQIALYVQPMVNAIIAMESDVSDYEPLISQINTNTILSVPISSINLTYQPATVPLNIVQDQVNYVTINQLHQTFNEMASATLLSGIDFIN
jgi:hypothetical protein